MTTANEIADKLAAEHNLTKAQGKALVEGVFKAIADAAIAGEEVSSRKLTFAPAKVLKEGLNR